MLNVDSRRLSTITENGRRRAEEKDCASIAWWVAKCDWVSSTFCLSPNNGTATQQSSIVLKIIPYLIAIGMIGANLWKKSAGISLRLAIVREFE